MHHPPPPPSVKLTTHQAGTASVVDPEGAKAAFHPTSDENARPGTPPEIAKCVLFLVFSRSNDSIGFLPWVTLKEVLFMKAWYTTLTKIMIAKFNRRFRKSTLHVPGRKVVHPGMANDPTVDHVTHGAKTVPSEPVQSVLQSQYPTNPVLLFQRQRAEEIYASAAREPLGATYKRGHVFPKGLGTETGFGVKSEVNPTSSVVKDMVFPTEIEPIMLGDANTSDAHAMYVKSHGNYAPGERRDRGYDWNAAGVDLGTTRFGRSTKPDALETMQRLLRDQSAPAATVEQTINPLKDATKRNAVTGAVIVDLKSETARAMNWDPLGRSKPLGTGITVDPKRVHGAPSRTRDDNGELEWDAKRLLAGDYSVEDQAPDPQIGKSMTRQGYAYEPASVLGTDDGRTFGVPSTRRDLAPPKMRRYGFPNPNPGRL